ncbi:hypothetical protein AUR64_07445 [Haloprofundus marisrubri]|uniref:DUF8116 domain-containing protein n=1 Tax=Haloprofundus marisrubri TaxID=1514971 RepID=A0A0W1RC38_9EURY|nr:hypothetical protein [Haloprofundus marisrubri]KTG10992.1 hypothetical protein AUR64_07445 [Haloprofundus marisrubri]
MTVFRLAALRTAEDFADWYRIGADYVAHIADGMEFDCGPFREDAVAGVEAMRAGHTDVEPRVARSIAATLLADAAFCEPFCEWLPLWYELALAGPNALAEYRLTRVARMYASDLPHVSVPQYSTPKEVLVEGRPALSHVSGFSDRFVLTDAILHLEWFVHVARESGVDLPPELLARTREETVAYYTGRRESLSPDVHRFQSLLFADDEWVRKINRTYGLDSTLFGVWEGILRRARTDLETAASGSAD